LHYLAKFWWAYANKIGGIGYWAQQYYGDPWYRANWPTAYDTSLIYPTEGGIIPSRRWQAWRRGWQDHCLLTLTRQYLNQAGDQKQRATLDNLIKTAVEYPGNPFQTENVRTWCKDNLAKEK